MNFLSVIDADLLASVLRSLIPILLAALGGMICERAGVFNIGLEGMILIGCFGAVAGSFFSGSWLVGALVGALAGAVFSLILGYGAIYRGGDPIVLAIAMNLLAIGITAFLIMSVFGVTGVFKDPGIAPIPVWEIPVLSGIPYLGELFKLTPVGYFALLLAPALWFMLFRTPLGLRLRGVGERPLAAATLGVNPRSYQLWTVVFSGALAGLGGAQLAIGNVQEFTEGMSAGRGWIAVVAVMLARAHPLGVLGAALLFGFTDAYGFRMQGLGWPQQLTDALPYVVTLVALLLMSHRLRKAKKTELA
ncbi:ABC transporter permease [Leucobacter sp. OH2974_COT-288]|uniref:Simple sugar transport system permease protein n=1 Tax=Canibacter oris TaxID=1365628 RepID=A0A840DKI0_9MICO|nr:ABC transporter permease [Canibacter oris]MBB4071982.1 simple sugar transport system permease protein [Canibacter oris]RRD35235.1 ABC transporter permease [Leucobacter sp. OH2974_COT-288]